MRKIPQTISVQRSAHYITMGELSKKTKHIWFCFHGYGQNADYMAGKFDFLDETEHFVICAEGLNKFYWHDNNEPVSCWMTKRHRYSEITDFVNFMDQLYNRYCKHVNQKTKIHLFGFSQGCATAWRWVHASQPRFTSLINWCGWIPEDISYLHLEDYLWGKKFFIHAGEHDPFMTPKMSEMMEEVISDNKLIVSKSTFDGKHHIPNEELEKFVKRIIA